VSIGVGTGMQRNRGAHTMEWD